MPLPSEVSRARVRAPAVPAELRLACLRRVARLLELLRAHGYPVGTPTVAFDLRGRTAGQAWAHDGHLRFNAVLLVENPDAMLRDTVGHELAHLAAVARHGRGIRPHGPEWQAAMRLMGLEPAVRHRFDTGRSAVVHAVHRWTCRCPTPHWLTDRRHRTALARGYRCLTCRAPMREATGTDAPRVPAAG